MIKLNKTTIAVLLLTALAMTIIPDMAMASGLQLALQNAIGILCDDVVKAIAVVAIIAVGMGALVGRLQWGVVAIVIVGVSITFSAGYIVQKLFGITVAKGDCK